MSVFDTCILIDCLQGIPQATMEIRAYAHPAISIITHMEVLAGAPTPQHEKTARALLSRFEVIEIKREIADLANEIRKNERLKLLDCIIWATAQSRNTVLITRNTKDFRENAPHIKVPYKL